VNKCPVDAPLPLKLLDLKASKRTAGIELSFTNTYESEVANYVLER
jgi:hypothetical protein